MGYRKVGNDLKEYGAAQLSQLITSRPPIRLADWSDICSLAGDDLSQNFVCIRNVLRTLGTTRYKYTLLFVIARHVDI